MKNNKGFTLVELLAVVAILLMVTAIIAPKVISNLKTAENVTEEEQINAIINTSKLYMNQNSNLLPENNNIYIITLNELKESGLIQTNQILNPNTKEQLTGCIIVTNNNKYEYEYTENTKTCNLKISVVSDKYKYYDPELIKNNPIYFNPTSGICTETDYANNEQKLGKTGCMKWYAYSENLDETVNMILDHNTTSNTDWVSSTDYSIQTGNSVGITYPQEYEFGTYQNHNGNHSSGPISALKQLKLDTDSWMNSLIRNDTYEETITNINGKKIEYTINYQNYKARLITAEEVATMTYAFKEKKYGGLGFTMNDTTQIYFYLDGKEGTADNWKTKVCFTKGASKYSWLFDNTGKDAQHLCESYGCSYNPIESMYTYGYWTSSANASKETDGWSVDYDGTLYNNAVYKQNRGIRPVITINKNLVMN